MAETGKKEFFKILKLFHSFDNYHDSGDYQGFILQTFHNLSVSFCEVSAHIHTTLLCPTANLNTPVKGMKDELRRSKYVSYLG